MLKDYDQSVLDKAFRGHKAFNDFSLKYLREDSDIENVTWGWQALSYFIFLQEGVYDHFTGNEWLGRRSTSDRIGNAFYDSNSLDEFYVKLNEILLEREMFLEERI